MNARVDWASVLDGDARTVLLAAFPRLALALRVVVLTAAVVMALIIASGESRASTLDTFATAAVPYALGALAGVSTLLVAWLFGRLVETDRDRRLAEARAHALATRVAELALDLEFIAKPLPVVPPAPERNTAYPGETAATQARLLADALQRAESASQAKSRFLAVVSHEVRTPLNGILGMAQLLADTPLTPEQQTYVDAVGTSGRELLALIEEILDFSAIEAGKLVLAPEPTALRPLIERTMELLAPQAQHKGLTVAADIDERLADTLDVDGKRLRQVLVNLVGNAVKFTATGGVGLMVEPDRTGTQLMIEVRDTGPGIAPADQLRIFHPFEQADQGPTRRHGGTGLGLAIARRIIDAMGGRIEVESMPADGAVFRIGLPMPGLLRATAAPLADLAGRHVLVVAPGRIERDMTGRRLQRWGATVSAVADPDVAATLVPERNWDALVVDRAAGFAEAVALAGVAGATVKSRIVLVTPAERHELPALRRAGFDAYLVKPVRAGSLAAVLEGRHDSADLTGPDLATPDLATPDLATPDLTGLAASAPWPAGTGARVLIAEDNPINALVASRLVGKLGHRPTLVGDGVAALEAIAAAAADGKPFALALVDLHMPLLDGPGVARALVAAGGPRPVLVALTADVLDEDRDAALAAGMDAYMTKPVDADRLAALLASHLSPALPQAA